MKLSNKNILIISPEPWNHIFVSKHHYAVYLSYRNNNVYFVNPPSSGLSINQTRYKNVFEVNYSGFPKGLRFYPSFIKKLIIRRVFRKLETLCRVKIDIVWSFDNSVFFDFIAIPNRVFCISHIVDLNQNFQFERAASTADVCFCTTDLIKERLIKFNKFVFKINHGYNDVGHANDPFSMPGNNKIKAVLIGNLAMKYLDWKILLETAKTHRDVDFLFFGPNAIDYSLDRNPQHEFKRKITQFPNVFFPGRIDSNQIPNVLANSDILLISYQSPYHPEQSNPHKLLEYFGSGKVVVATWTGEYEKLSSELIVMSKNNEDFILNFTLVKSNLAKYKHPILSAERINIANQNSYPNQLNRIEEVIRGIPNFRNLFIL